MRCPNENEDIEVTPLAWENVKYTIDKKTAEIKEDLEGVFTQIPLKAAWAITIHKSQGLTFEKAVIDAEASFAHGQVYVALSRCKTLEGLVLSRPISARSIINDKTVGSFIKNVEENQPDENKLWEARLSYQKELLAELFQFKRTMYLIGSLTKLAFENKGSFPEMMVELFSQIQQKAKTEIADVADRFLVQVDKYLGENANIETNDKLQERIRKAAAFFSDKLNEIIRSPLEKADLDIDNKAIKKQLHYTLENLEEELSPKLAGFEVCKTKFEVKQLLREQSVSALQQTSGKAKNQKAKPIDNPENIPHPELYKTLRSWRYEKAQESAIPVYMVFSQKALIEMVNYLPIDSKMLQLINGMGARKMEQFGADILQIIQHYCIENEVERGTIPLKTSSSKEKKPKVDTKKVTFELFQSGKIIEEIASERGLTSSTIENHLAHFVKLGELDVTKLIDEKKLKKITAYFKKAEDKSFTTAKNHFGNEVSYGELRVALSFLERETS